MFASSSQVRRALLMTASAAVIGALAASPASALEGIQGRHAIFYPSLELVYQHDDNFYLTPDNEIAADTFIAHAHFALEVPGARQYLRVEYQPQYRDVNTNKGPGFSLDNALSHEWNLDARLKGSAVFGVDINQDLTIGSLETYAIDPNRELVITSGEQFLRHNLDVNFKWNGSRQGASILVGKEDSQFDRVSKAPAWFELDAWRLGAEYHWKFAPLTRFFVGIKHQDSNQDYTPEFVRITDPDGAGPASGITTLDSTDDQLYMGFDGELGRTTTGRAQIGFDTLNYERTGRAAESDWSGVALRADIEKDFSRWTKLKFNAERRPNFSGYGDTPSEFNTYYVSNRASFTLDNQPQGGKVGWSLIGQFQRNGYDNATMDTTLPVPVRKDRSDDIARLRAEVGFHPLEHLSFRLNYQWEQRDSTHDHFDYTDNLVIFQVQFGF